MSTENATLVAGDLAEAITDLKQQPGGNIGVHGSLTLVEGLLQADLLDEMRLEIYPVLAGTGARLFHDQRCTETPSPRRLADREQRRRRPDLRARNVNP